MKRVSTLILFTVGGVFFTTLARPQDVEPPQPGIAIRSEQVRRACGGCHPADEGGRMSRISYRRATPEGWQATIRRMAGLIGAPVDPEDARQILKYLADHLGLAPEEARPAMFEVERRAMDHHYPHQQTEKVCTQCHSMGRIMSERRTREEWELLVSMHRGYYPQSDFQAFRRGAFPVGEFDEGENPRHPMEVAIDHLTQTFAFHSPAWERWSAVARPPRLAGRWALSGYQRGKGAVYGEMTIEAVAGSPDLFQTRTRYRYGGGAERLLRRGEALVYTGFQWRGRSAAEGGADALREVLFVEPDWQTMWGRWFRGAYDEFGLDVKLRRLGKDPVILGVEPAALRLGRPARLRIHGLNFPASPVPDDLDLGPGIDLRRVLGAGSDQIEVEVAVAAEAAVGSRDLFLRGAVQESALVLYDRVDRIEVSPQAGFARVGGAVFPRQFEQFEARACHNGVDGRPGTADDLDLGRVRVHWSLEEYPATFFDDDRQFVGSIDGNGFFTPALDGPNPERRNGTNNIGDVWVLASWEDPEAEHRPRLKGRAQLVVGPPLYVKWDQPGVAP